MSTRITGGVLKGRILSTPRAGLRPTQERVREAVFSMVAAQVEGARALDLFAGSGSLGLEAWSRGAASVTWVEEQPAIHRLLARQVRALCAEEPDSVQCRCADVFRFLDAYAGAPFDLILADPPYEKGGEKNWAAMTLAALDRLDGLSAPGAVLVLELASGQALPEAERWALVRDKSYGGTRVALYRKRDR